LAVAWDVLKAGMWVVWLADLRVCTRAAASVARWVGCSVSSWAVLWAGPLVAAWVACSVGLRAAQWADVWALV